MINLTQEIHLIDAVFDQYIKKTDEIELFILSVENQKDFIKNVNVTSSIEDYITGLNKLSNSVVLYNAAIISIYGSYELFVDELLIYFISYLKRNKEYDAFPKLLVDKYMNRSCDFLTNPQRYSNLGLNSEMIISSLHASYIQKDSNEFLEQLMISHSGNLKSKQLNSLLLEFGIQDSFSLLTNHYLLNKFFSDYSVEKLEDGIFPILDTIVEERNKVGHGWRIDTRISFALLREYYLPFIRCLCEALKDLILSTIIQDSINNNDIVKFSPILHVWKNGSVIGINSGHFRLKVGEYLFYSTNNNWNYSFKILNLQNDKHDRNEIRSVSKDISIESNHKIKENYEIYGYVQH